MFQDNYLSVIQPLGADPYSVESLNFAREAGGTFISQSLGRAELDYMPKQEIQQGVYDWEINPEGICGRRQFCVTKVVGK